LHRYFEIGLASLNILLLFCALSLFFTVDISDDDLLSVFLNDSLLEECSVDIHKDVHQEHNA